MPIQSLPDNPDLQRLKGIATTLRDFVRAGVPESLDLVREHHPRHPGLVADSPDAAGFKLADAQLTVARMYGYPSWPRLRRYVELVRELSRSPHDQPVGLELTDDHARADELLRLACLNYGADHRSRWQEAARLLGEHPRLAGWSIHTAAATGDLAAATAILAADPTAAGRQGGPFEWAPLLYLTYSRLPPADRGHDHVAVCRLLLDNGADPNAGFLWDGLPSPFTALTGVFGRGEQGAPPHRDELTLARLLLAAGADANDSQTIYNRGLGDIARDDTEFLEMLLDHGLGSGDGGPWHRLLGHEHQAPDDLMAEALQHAAEAGLPDRARLLLARGADPDRPGTHPAYLGRRPYEGAIVYGNMSVADMLAAAGADTSGVDPLARFVGACLAGDRSAVDADPSLLDRARRERTDLIARAAELGRPDAIRLLADLGFNVNARHRTTALHEAALRGNVDVATVLIELGADPTIHDTEFDSPPSGWARHNGHDAMAAYLDSLR